MMRFPTAEKLIEFKEVCLRYQAQKRRDNIEAMAKGLIRDVKLIEFELAWFKSHAPESLLKEWEEYSK